MRAIVNLSLWGIFFALALAMIGFWLVWVGAISRKNSKRHTALAATLAAAAGLWLAERSSFALGRTGFDLVTLFFVLWFSCFFLFWAGIATGLKTFGHHHGHSHDFGESSILSMQYLESRMYNPHDGPPPNFQETEILLGARPAGAATANPSTSAQGKDVSHSSVTGQKKS